MSAHLDDAAFGCGAWLAARPGAVVLTLFAGVPPHPRRSTEWDRRCGYASAADAIAGRREEDRTALGHLRARPRWLPFLDGQYRDADPPADLPALLAGELRRLGCTRLLLPFGLVHPDHRLAHAAALAAWRRLPGTEAWAYEDCPYRREPGALQRRLVELAGAGVVATPTSGSGRASRRAKALAIDAYRSQWLALGAAAREDVCRPEGIWALRIEP